MYMSDYNKISNEVLSIIQIHIDKNKHRKFRNKHRIKLFSSTAEEYVTEELKACFASIYEKYLDLVPLYKVAMWRFDYHAALNYDYSVNIFQYEPDVAVETYEAIENIFQENLKHINFAVKDASDYKKKETEYINSNIDALNKCVNYKKYLLNKKLKKIKNV